MFPYDDDDDDDEAAFLFPSCFPSSDIFIGLVLLLKGHDADDWCSVVLAGDFAVWLASSKARCPKGRIVWAN